MPSQTILSIVFDSQGLEVHFMPGDSPSMVSFRGVYAHTGLGLDSGVQQP